MSTLQADEAEVREVVLTLLRDWTSPEPESTERFLAGVAPHFTGFGTGPGDYYADRDDLRAMVRREHERMAYPFTLDVPWLTVRLPHASVAHAEGQLRVEVEAGEETLVEAPRFTFLLERQGDERWLLVHFHFSVPDMMQNEGDTMDDLLWTRNRELERLVEERTAALRATQDELEREHALRAEAAEAVAAYLRAENERQTRELEQARALQLGLLPAEMPEHPFAEVAASMQTATEVGGDYYDFHVGADGALTFAIGDATGHGAQAGIVVTAAKSLFTTYADEPDPAAVLRKASASMRQFGLPNLFMAFALGKLRGHRLELAGAGMPPAHIYRAATGRIESVSLRGMPLGGPMQYPYRSARIELAPGDTLLLMSDGFPEMKGDGGRWLGYDNVGAVFSEIAGAPPQEVVRHFGQRAESWLGGRPPDDDMTFVVLRRIARRG